MYPKWTYSTHGLSMATDFGVCALVSDQMFSDLKALGIPNLVLYFLIEELHELLGVDSHSCQPSTQLFSLGFRRFSRKTDPWTEWGRYP